MKKRNEYAENEAEQYYTPARRAEILEGAKAIRRKFVRYKDAEYIDSIQHKKLLELAGKAGAILRIDGTVLIDRELFDHYLEQFREESTLKKGKR